MNLNEIRQPPFLEYRAKFDYLAIMIPLPPETERLARRVAERSGKTPEEVVRLAIETEARIAGIAVAEGRTPHGGIDRSRVKQITHRIAGRPLLDERTPKEIRDQAWGEPG